MKQCKRFPLWLAALALVVPLLVMAGCGGSSTPATKTTVAGSVSTTDGTAASDLTVATPAGVTLKIPQSTTLADTNGAPVSGAISSSVSVSTSTADLPTAAGTLPSGATLAAFVDIGLGTVKSFSRPVSLTINAAASGAKSGDMFVVYSFDSSTNQWTFAGTEVADANGDVVTTISHLSVWGLFKSSTPPPVKPTGVTASVTTGEATLNWSTVSGATSYSVYYGTAAGVTKATAGNSVTNVASTTLTIPGLLNGTAYHFVVTAVNANGESIESSEISATPVAKPQGISVTAGDAKVTVAWSAAAGATSYKIYYGTTTGVTTATGTVVADAVTPQVITGLSNGTTYFFVVTAVNPGGESAISSEKSATPAAAPQPPPNPTGVTVSSPGAGQLSVNWNAVVGATSYNAYYLQSATAQTTTTVIATGSKQSSTAPPAAISGLASGTYYVVVTAVNAAGESGGQTSPKSAVVQ